MTFFDTFYKGFNFQLKIKISILTLVTNRSIHKLTSTHNSKVCPFFSITDILKETLPLRRCLTILNTFTRKLLLKTCRKRPETSSTVANNRLGVRQFPALLEVLKRPTVYKRIFIGNRICAIRIIA